MDFLIQNRIYIAGFLSWRIAACGRAGEAFV
jgi:hypothetical protein